MCLSIYQAEIIIGSFIRGPFDASLCLPVLVVYVYVYVDVGEKKLLAKKNERRLLEDVCVLMATIASAKGVIWGGCRSG